VQILDDLRPWLILIVAAASLWLSVVVYRRQVQRDDVADLQARISALTATDGALSERLVVIHDRLVEVEARLDHMPSADAVHKLGVDMARMQGDLHAIAEGSKALIVAVQRIEDYMLRSR